MLSKIDGIYTETDNLKLNLNNIGFTNVKKLHNFRMIKYPEIENARLDKENIKLVFMARVHPLKGVEWLFELDRQLKTQGIRNVTVDIYGPINADYEQKFFEQLNATSVNYCGVIEPTAIYGILKNYDLMLFPTLYFTEGFPGTILDAYISGVPTIATRWLNAEEFIDNGITGFIVNFNNMQAFIEKIILLVENPEEIILLTKQVIRKREEFSDIKAWDILKDIIHKFFIT